MRMTNKLFMALKTINISWVHIQRDKNVQEAFKEIGKCYDDDSKITLADICYILEDIYYASSSTLFADDLDT